MLPGEKVQRPVVRRPTSEVLLVKRDESHEEVRLADLVGPRDREGHLIRRVDALLGNPSERGELVARAESQLQTRSLHAQPVEDLYLHAGCLPCCAASAVT